jgi:DNA repair protein SbcD/Mre11
VIHTADWHLGKLLNDQSRDEEHERFLSWLLALSDEAAVDAIIVAGDIFDSANPPQSALSRYYNFVSELNKRSGCALVIIGGNHDSASLLEAPKQLLQAFNVHVAGALHEEPASRILLLPSAENPRIAVALLPFLRDRDLRTAKAGQSMDEVLIEVAEGIKRRYEEAAAAGAGFACPMIATGHLTVSGMKPSDSERQIRIGGLASVESAIFPSSFSYVALGHLHRPQEARGNSSIRYAGSPIALSFSEAADTKEVRLIDFGSDGITQHPIPVPVFRRLEQLRPSRQNLLGEVAGFDPRSGELRTWVEVIVEDAAPGDDIVELVRSAAESGDFEVLKVCRGGATSLAGMAAGDLRDDEAIDSLLYDPDRVFGHLLGEHPSLDEEEIKQLKAAFAELRAINDQTD